MLSSKRTRRKFERYLVVSKVLREINDYFEDSMVSENDAYEYDPSRGQRSNLVRSYYSSVQWDDDYDVRRITKVYADIMNDLEEDIVKAEGGQHYGSNLDQMKGYRYELESCLRQDGFEWVNSKLVRIGTRDLPELIPDNEAYFTNTFDDYVSRIQTSVEDDPPLAVGTSKDLCESVLKHICERHGILYAESDQMPNLLKKVQDGLKIATKDVDQSIAGSKNIKILLSNLGQVVVKVYELRNTDGTGHGRVGGYNVTSRHARLVSGAAITLCRFLLETSSERYSNLD